MLGARRSMVVLAAVFSLVLAGCAEEKHPLGSAAGLALPTPTPSPGACTIVDRSFVAKTFDEKDAAQDGREEEEPFLTTGKELTCEFKASGGWSLTASRATFTSSASPTGVLNNTIFKDDPNAKRISGVGDAAGYSEKTGSFAQFVTIDKTVGDRGVLVLLFGTKDSDSESNFTALAKEILRRSPQ